MSSYLGIESTYWFNITAVYVVEKKARVALPTSIMEDQHTTSTSDPHNGYAIIP